MCDEDLINPTIDGKITRDRDNSCTLDSYEELEHLQNRLHKVSTLRYNMMTKLLHCVSTEVRNLSHYDGLQRFCYIKVYFFVSFNLLLSLKL